MRPQGSSNRRNESYRGWIDLGDVIERNGGVETYDAPLISGMMKRAKKEERFDRFLFLGNLKSQSKTVI